MRFKKTGSDLEAKKSVLAIQCGDLIGQGKLMLLDREYPGAIKLFNRVLKTDKANIHAKFYRGIAWLDL